MDSPQDLGQTSIETLRLSRRTCHALQRSDVFTVGELNELFQNNRLENIFFIGEKSIDEVSNALNEFYKEASNPMPIKILNLSASTRGALIRKGLNTIGDLRFTTDGMLLNINRIGPKALIEIRQALDLATAEPDKYIKIKTEYKSTSAQANKSTATWAEIIQSYFESEKDNYIYVLLSRIGFKPKTLEEIASELNVTRERVRQIQELATVRFLKHVRLSSSPMLLEKTHGILFEYGENLSLKKFKSQLVKENLLGEFSPTLMSERISKIDLFETLICWLNLLSDPKHNQPPVEFPVGIKALIESDSITIKDSEKLQSISPKLSRKIKRKVYFTGGISIKEASKILSEDERTTELILQNLNLKKIKDYWYSLKIYDAKSDTSRIPLWTAGVKMLAIKPDIHLDIFYDGLRRYINRFYPSIAPVDIIAHILKLLGFEINNQQIVSTRQNNKNILSQSEKSVISAITKSDGVATFMEIVEEFFLQNLSLPAVTVTLKRSPIVEKVEDGLYKLRGVEISWQQIDKARQRQKRFSQDYEIAHGLDGIVRVSLTANSYAYLSGVVASSVIKEMVGSWSVIYKNESFGDAKMDEGYLWGLSKVFKKLDIQMGDRIELAFNTWDRTLSIEKVNHGTA